MSNGKGDTPRPKTVSEVEYARNWARIFCKHERVKLNGMCCGCGRIIRGE